MTGAPSRKSPHVERISITEGLCTDRPVAVFHRIEIYVGRTERAEAWSRVGGPDSRSTRRHRGPRRAARVPGRQPPNRLLPTVEQAQSTVSGRHGRRGVQGGARVKAESPRGATRCEGGAPPPSPRLVCAQEPHEFGYRCPNRRYGGGRHAVVLSTGTWASHATTGRGGASPHPSRALARRPGCRPANRCPLPKHHRIGRWQPDQRNGDTERGARLWGAGDGATRGARASTRRGCTVSAMPTWRARLSCVGMTGRRTTAMTRRRRRLRLIGRDGQRDVLASVPAWPLGFGRPAE